MMPTATKPTTMHYDGVAIQKKLVENMLTELDINDDESTVSTMRT